LVDTDLLGKRSSRSPNHSSTIGSGRNEIGIPGRNQIGIGGRNGVGISGRNPIGLGGRNGSESARWSGFARFLDDGRIDLSNNAAERALRGIAMGRKSWLFAGSDRGGQRAAIMYSLIVTAKMNDVDPQAWLADVLGRIAEHPASKVDDLLPWNWENCSAPNTAAA
jgi:hypothetical protein